MLTRSTHKSHSLLAMSKGTKILIVAAIAIGSSPAVALADTPSSTHQDITITHSSSVPSNK